MHLPLRVYLFNSKEKVQCGLLDIQRSNYEVAISVTYVTKSDAYVLLMSPHVFQPDVVPGSFDDYFGTCLGCHIEISNIFVYIQNLLQPVH